MADTHVLVVDDEDLILQVLKEFFRMRGDHCDTAGHGQEALKMVEDKIYDLILSDISMPGMDGLELVRRVKLIQPQTVCILMSGLGTRRDILTALKIGVFDFIDKPIPDLAALTMIVDRASEAGRLTRERDSLLENLREQNTKLEYSLVRLHEAFSQLRQQEQALESDLRKAQHVQRKFLPSSFPSSGRLDLFGYYSPADQLGGDFFDTLTFPDGRLAFYLVDVAGHGVSAAMITVTFRELIRAERRRSGSDRLFSEPEDLIRFMNQSLLRERFDPPIFVSMVYAVFSPATGEMVIASAGHPSPLYLMADGRFGEVPCRGAVLGTNEVGEVHTAVVTLQPGDALLFYSDGLIECRSAGGEEFSLDAVRRALTETQGQPARVTGERVEQRLLEHLGGMALTDDVSYIIASIAPVNAPPPLPEAADPARNSVKVLLPDGLRHIRTDARGRVQGGWHDQLCIVVAAGTVTWQVAPALREIIRQGLERSSPPIHIDLSACDSMDSTALGLLLQHASSVVLHRPQKRVVGQLHEMGVLHLFTISHEPAADVEVPIPVAPNDTQEACSELILSAHEALMEASASNRQKFKDVVDAIKQPTPKAPEV